jgi:hypothetical protein
MQSIAPAQSRKPKRNKRKGGRCKSIVPRNAPLKRGLLEQGQNGLRRLIGDRQSLNAQLLLDLQRL